MVDVNVVVSLTVFVTAGGVTVETGVEVTLTVAILVTVKAMVFVGTRFFEAPPRRVVQSNKDFVESPKADEERAKTPHRS